MWIAFIVLVIAVIALYNDLVSLRQRVKNAWSQIDVQLQRRFDLIPNLVETVKGYMGHESDVLTKVTELRTSWANASTVKEKSELDSELSGALKTIMAVSENYPELKASANFSQLQEELQNTEIIASMFHFEPEQLFEAESQEARKNVKVDFNK